MKTKLILLTFLMFSAYTINAQEWLIDIDQAKKEAVEKNQNIVLVFKGSDWCAPCMKLEREIFSSQEFKEYAKDHFVMLEADFPKRKKNKLDESQQEKNNRLAEEYNKRGFFPHVVVLNHDGKVLGRTGYKKTTPQEYIKILNSF